LIAIASFVPLFAGCQDSAAQRQAKREQDRMAMQLADAERDRDAYKSQIDALKGNLAQAVQKQEQAQTQLVAANEQVKKLEDELVTARGAQANLEQLTASLTTAQQQLADGQRKAKDLQTQIEALKAELEKRAASSTQAPATQPTMNK
jgi:chromosome segregation ATPase